MANLNGAGQMLERDDLQALHSLSQVIEQIQVLDYELHASLRILAKGEMESEHMTAFMQATAQRDLMMSRVVSYVAKLRSRRAKDRQKSTSSVLAQRVTAPGE